MRTRCKSGVVVYAPFSRVAAKINVGFHLPPSTSLSTRACSHSGAGGGGASGDKGKENEGTDRKREKSSDGRGDGSGGGVKKTSHKTADNFRMALAQARRNMDQLMAETRFPVENELYFDNPSDFAAYIERNLTHPILDDTWLRHAPPTVPDDSPFGSANWTVKQTDQIHSIFHGTPSWVYKNNFIEKGCWDYASSDDKGELYPGSAIYFATSPYWAMWFSMFDDAATVTCLEDLRGIVIEMPLLRTNIALINGGDNYGEEFARANRTQKKTNPQWSQNVIASTFSRTWTRKPSSSSFLNQICCDSHQIAIIDCPRSATFAEMLPNREKSRTLIVRPPSLPTGDPRDQKASR